MVSQVNPAGCRRSVVFLLPTYLIQRVCSVQCRIASGYHHDADLKTAANYTVVAEHRIRLECQIVIEQSSHLLVESNALSQYRRFDELNLFNEFIFPRMSCCFNNTTLHTANTYNVGIIIAVAARLTGDDIPNEGWGSNR